MNKEKWFTEKQWADAQEKYRKYREEYLEKYGEYPKDPVLVLAGRIKKS